MRKIIATLLFGAFIITAATSCITDEKQIGKSPVETGGDTQLLLRLKTPGSFSTPSTRMTTAQENAIENIYVLVFDDDNELVDIKQGENIENSTTPPSGNYSGQSTFTITLPASRADDRSKLVVLANAVETLTATIGTGIANYNGPQSKEYDDVIAAITAGFTAKHTATTIPMWGETGLIQITPSNQNLAVALTRALARIDVGVGALPFNWNGLNGQDENVPFRLNEVYVMRPTNKYAVIPDTEELTVGKGTIPTGATQIAANASETTFAYTVTNGYFTTQEIYVPEADILITPSDRPGDENHEARMAIVVGGVYDANGNGNFDDDGGVSYYRIDFSRNGALMNVLRNHLYLFNISRVLGRGYSTVEEAYEANAMSITANILDWNPDDIPSYLVGEYFSITVNQTDNGAAMADYRIALPGMDIMTLATPEPGYMFTGWTAEHLTLSEAQATANPMTFIMPGNNVELTPVFTIAQYYMVVMEAPETGLSTPEQVGVATATPYQNVLAGEQVMLSTTETDQADYSFSGWEVDAPAAGGAIAVTATNPASFTMPASHVTANAVFTRKLHRVILDTTLGITIGAANNGGTNAILDGVYSGETVSFTATADQSHVFNGWNVSPAQGVEMDLSGVDLNANLLTFAMPKGEVSVTARSEESFLNVFDVTGSRPIGTLSNWNWNQSGSNAAKTIKIYSNVAWSIAPVTGFTISPMSGSPGNGVEVTVCPTANNTNTANDVSGTITVSGGGITAEVAVKQFKQPSLSATTPTAFAATDGTTASRTITITSNVTWTASILSSAQFTISTTSGGPNGSIMVRPKSQNSATTPRSALVTITGAGLSAQTITVSQSAAAPSLLINNSTSALTLSWTSGQAGNTVGIYKEFTVSSNVAWSISGVSNFTVSPTSGNINNAAGNVTTVRVYPSSSNPSADATRGGTLRIMGSNITRSVNVTQGKAAFTAPPSTAPSVTIGDLVWAGSNLSGYKTFATNSTDYGAYFVWGSNVAYTYTSAKNAIIPAQSSTPTAYWPDNQNPCPTGWRLPTGIELGYFEDHGGYMTNKNNVRGFALGNVFLPAAGIQTVTGQGGWTPATPGVGGGYLTSTGYAYGTDPYVLFFADGYVTESKRYLNGAYSVRCVRPR